MNPTNESPAEPSESEVVAKLAYAAPELIALGRLEDFTQGGVGGGGGGSR